MESFECDVVVIGAGLSGLTAAYYLTKKDQSLRICVLEAKDRIGGRTLTRQLISADGSKDFWDLGGEWVGRPQVHIQYLLHKFHINTFTPVSPKDGRQITKVPSLSFTTRLDLKQFSWKLRRMRTKIMGKDLTKTPDALLWDKVVLSDVMEEYLWTQGAKSVVDSACRCMFGLAPDDMSLLFFLMYIKAAGDFEVFIQPLEFTGGECRVKGGVGQLANHMINKIGKRLVYLSQPVTDIKQNIEGAHIVTSNDLHILCQRVIMAVPPHHAAAIMYEPPLPNMKLSLLQNAPLAYLLKFVFTYEEPFWMDTKDSLAYVFQGVLEDAVLGPLGVVYDATSGRGNAALGGFINSYQGLDKDVHSRKAVILRLIEKLIGSQCHKFLDFSILDWSREPYNGGCFLKAMNPDINRYFNDGLRQPHDRVHFAGTETATVWCGFMNGAVQSGLRAATEVLYHLRPLIATSPEPDTPRHENYEFRERGSSNWISLAAIGFGFATAIYFLSIKDRHSYGPTFVKNIQLVFDPQSTSLV